MSVITAIRPHAAERRDFLWHIGNRHLQHGREGQVTAARAPVPTLGRSWEGDVSYSAALFPYDVMSNRILLVDDEPCTVFVIEYSLRQHGFEVACAADGDEAWAIVEQQKPDLIIADYQMPGLNGLELTARVRANPETRGIPIILFTAKGFELSAEEILEEFGIVAMLPKPYHPREFIRLIERTLRPPLVEQA